MDSITTVDLRTVSIDVPPQEILTKDSVTIQVDAVVYYKIMNPMAAVCNVEDYAKSTKLLASTTLRTILGTKTMAEILTDRDHIAEEIMHPLDKATDPHCQSYGYLNGYGTYINERYAAILKAI